MTKRIHLPFLHFFLWIGVALGACLAFPISAGANTHPESAFVSGFVGYAQSYSLSCESRSAVDWASFWGIQISEVEFQGKLPRSDNPDAGFVGNVHDPWGNIPPDSYGVHAGPVAELLRQYGMQAEASRGLTWDDLRAEIAAGRPVIVWIIGQMWAGTPRSYTTSDGSVATVASFEHTIVLVGYTHSTVHVVDSYSGQAQVYSLGAFLASWEALGNMAVTGYREKSPDAAPSLPEGDTYTVQRGDFLIALARRFDLSWRELADLNGISFPYVIYPGQVLQLPARAGAGEPSPTIFEPLPAGPSADQAAASHSLQLPVVYVGGRPPASAQPAPDAEQNAALPETYVVQRGDYLDAIAKQFGTDWKTLADLNDIPYAYVIYPGQVLRLR